uniref:PH domain-containing protein n=1 Tax=Hemiselmis tepida TaxID=464990 RepID=A0A7S0VVW1_9CRYP|mmetsp:Transcript_30230/g.76627  ORF Transcript_30230/g.76627 Transcript_30230/m.76627 type:complete len:212 (+) Transcript_30230:70-705(+)
MPSQVSFGRPRAGEETEAMRREGSFHVEGGLWKLGKTWSVNSKAGIWYKKFAILHNKAFHIYESHRAFGDGEPSRQFALEKATIERLDETDGVRSSPNCFIIGITDQYNERQHYFAVASEVSRDHWIACLQDAAKVTCDGARHKSMPNIMAANKDSNRMLDTGFEEVSEDPSDAYEVELNRKQRINSFIVQMAEEDKKKKMSFTRRASDKR